MKEEVDSPGKSIIWGITFISLAIFLFLYLAAIEHGYSGRPPRIVMWIYNLGGKYLVSGICLIIGIFSIKDGYERLNKK